MDTNMAGGGRNQAGRDDPYAYEAGDTLVLDARPKHKGRGGLFARLIPWLALVGMLAFVGFGLFRCTRVEEANVRVGDIAAATGRGDRVSAQTTEAYRRTLDDYSEAKAKEALSERGTFVSPTVGVRETPKPVPATPRILERPIKEVEKPQKPKEEARQTRTVEARSEPRRPQERAVPRRQEKRGDERMMGYLSSLAEKSVQAQGTMVLNKPRDVVRKLASASVSLPESGLPGLKVGDILQAVNRVSLDSDAPGPAMVEVVSGPYKGAKVVGSFQRINEHLVLRFSELAARDGTLYKIEGYAIDPKTDRTAVRTDVDRHLLARWGGLVAASFLEGFGDAVSRSGTSSYASVYGSGYSVPNYDLRDETWIAAGKVGERMANVMDRNFNQAPTVTLDSGTLMGVLLLRIPQESANARSAPRVVEVGQTGATGIGARNDTSSRIEGEQARVQAREEELAKSTPAMSTGSRGYGYPRPGLE